MRKLKCTVVLEICMLLLCGMTVSAQENYVYDQADLLSAQEESYLENLAAERKEQWDINFVAVTTNDAEGKSSMDYADDFYDTHFQDSAQEDGVLYLIDMDNREIYLSTCGQAIRYLTDSRVENILDKAYEHVADGDYYKTFVAFMDETEYYLTKGIPSDQYNYDTQTDERDYYRDSYEKPKRITITEFVIALVSALAAAGGFIGAITAKYQLKFEDFHYDAYTASDVSLSVKQDRLVNTFVTHRRIPRNNGGSHGGGGGSRSSVHRSSGGRSHGGGGRSF